MADMKLHSGDTFDKLTEAVKAAERNVESLQGLVAGARSGLKVPPEAEPSAMGGKARWNQAIPASGTKAEEPHGRVPDYRSGCDSVSCVSDDHQARLDGRGVSSVYDELADVFAQAHIERLRRMEDETE